MKIENWSIEKKITTSLQKRRKEKQVDTISYLKLMTDWAIRTNQTWDWFHLELNCSDIGRVSNSLCGFILIVQIMNANPTLNLDSFMFNIISKNSMMNLCQCDYKYTHKVIRNAFLHLRNHIIYVRFVIIIPSGSFHIIRAKAVWKRNNW